MITQAIVEKLSSLVRHGDDGKFDIISLVCIMMLGLTSIFFIYSAQSYSGGKQWIMQIVWLMMGGAVYGLLSVINYKIFLEYAHIIYAIGIVMLLLIWSPLGMKVYGAQRWLNFGAFSVQASDPAKIGTLILGSAILARSKITDFRSSLKTIDRKSVV